MPFEFIPLALPGVILMKPRVFADERGFFLETYRLSEFSEVGFPPFVQTNHSHSERNVLRGLHFQKKPAAQGKLVTAISGEIFDVAVDIRVGSPTYGHWVGEVLSAQNHHLLYIPPGFAHGFCVLSEVADVVYQVTAEYVHALDRGILWNDPMVAVKWPVTEPLLSAKDLRQPFLAEADNNFDYEAG